MYPPIKFGVARYSARIPGSSEFIENLKLWRKDEPYDHMHKVHAEMRADIDLSCH